MARLRIRIRNSMYARRDRYDGHITEFNEYEGEIYPNPKWVSADCFCLTTGDSQFPFRIISKEDIVHGWLLPQSSTTFSPPLDTPTSQTSSVTYQVQSKDKIYLVTRSNNKLSCNCTGFSYRRTCSHIKEVANV